MISIAGALRFTAHEATLIGITAAPAKSAIMTRYAAKSSMRSRKARGPFLTSICHGLSEPDIDLSSIFDFIDIG
jgi:hypothetical protein